MTSGIWLSALVVWKPFIMPHREGGLLHALSQLPKCLVGVDGTGRSTWYRVWCRRTYIRRFLKIPSPPPGGSCSGGLLGPSIRMLTTATMVISFLLCMRGWTLQKICFTCSYLLFITSHKLEASSDAFQSQEGLDLPTSRPLQLCLPRFWGLKGPLWAVS